jgi:hypothetical protein
MCQRLLNSNTFPWMDLNHFSHKVKRIRGSTWELTTQWWWWLIWQLSHETPCFLGSDKVKLVVLQLAEFLTNESQLR